jgi:hypothetical protein
MLEWLFSYLPTLEAQHPINSIIDCRYNQLDHLGPLPIQLGPLERTNASLNAVPPFLPS